MIRFYLIFPTYLGDGDPAVAPLVVEQESLLELGNLVLAKLHVARHLSARASRIKYHGHVCRKIVQRIT